MAKRRTSVQKREREIQKRQREERKAVKAAEKRAKRDQRVEELGEGGVASESNDVAEHGEPKVLVEEGVQAHSGANTGDERPARG